MASIGKRTRQGQVRWRARFRDPAGEYSLRHYFSASLISRGASVVAVSHWVGHSNPGITHRAYADLEPDDEQAGRDAIAETMRHVVSHVYPWRTEEGSR